MALTKEEREHLKSLMGKLDEAEEHDDEAEEQHVEEELKGSIEDTRDDEEHEQREHDREHDHVHTHGEVRHSHRHRHDDFHHFHDHDVVIDPDFTFPEPEIHKDPPGEKNEEPEGAGEEAGGEEAGGEEVLEIVEVKNVSAKKKEQELKDETRRRRLGAR